MTDEFNLVPTNNLEKHLDNILRVASGEEPLYDLAPNWTGASNSISLRSRRNFPKVARAAVCLWCMTLKVR